jgi:hypothetical protein
MFTNVDWADTARKTARTFVFAFLAVYPAPAIIGALSGTQPLDTSAVRAAAVAGLAAVISVVWRVVVDPSPIPSLAPKADAE